MDKVPMTAEGHAAMMDEVKHLKSVERPRIIKVQRDIGRVPVTEILFRYLSKLRIDFYHIYMSVRQLGRKVLREREGTTSKYQDGVR